VITYVYPVHDRWDLLAMTLGSIATQQLPRGLHYEVLIIDDCSRVPYPAAGLGNWDHLPLRVIRIETVPSSTYCLPDGGHNPSRAWNVGIREALGAWVGLSSPEVMHTLPTNLAWLEQAVWALARANQLQTAVIADVYDETWRDTEFDGWIGGGVRERMLNFLAVYPKAALVEMGGFDEDFLAGFAFEDNEFADRWVRRGGRYVFTHQQVTAEHLPHPRPAEGEVAEGVRINQALYAVSQQSARLLANTGRIWGVAGIPYATWQTAGWLSLGGGP
jgi:hypothetical protein